MAHNLENNTSMVYAASGGTPWHELGIAIPDGKTATESLALWGGDYDVHLRPTYALVGGLFQQIPDVQSVVRVGYDGQDRDTIATVGMKYSPLQTSKLAEWADTLSAASEGRAQLECAGSLDGGRRFWFLMKHNGDGGIRLAGDDSAIEKYLAVLSSHDGTLNATMLMTATRVVCQNTFNIALREGTRTQSNVIKVRHTASAETKVDAAIAAIGVADSYFDSLARLADGLTRTPFTRQQYSALVDGLLNIRPETDKSSKVPTRTANERDKLVDLLDTTPGAQPGTAWGAYNAIVDYADHHAPMRLSNGTTEAEARCARQISGVAVELKQSALDLICAATVESWGSLQLKQIAADTAARQGNLDGKAILADIIAGY